MTPPEPFGDGAPGDASAGDAAAGDAPRARPEPAAEARSDGAPPDGGEPAGGATTGEPAPGAVTEGSADGRPPAQYTAAEQQALRAAVAAGSAPRCPRDGAALTRRPLGGGSFGLGYARRREWLICPTCRRSALFDVRRGTRN